MIRILLLLTTLCCGVTPLRAYATLNAEPPEHDFGNMPNYSVVDREFVLTNTGDDQINIVTAKTSCGCLQVVDAPTTVIEPGGRATLRVRLALAGLRGKLQESVLVVYKGKTHGEMRLSIRGTVANSISVKNPFVTLGQIGQDSGAQDVVDLISESVQDFRVTKAEVGSPVTARIEEIKVGKAYRVHIEVPPNANLGEIGRVVRIHTNIKDAPPIEVPVMGVVIGDMAIFPASVVFSARESPGETQGRSLRVQSTKGKSFQITRVELPVDGIAHAIEPLAGGGFTIRLSKLVPSELDGLTMIIHTDVAEASVIEVPFRIRGSTERR